VTRTRILALPRPLRLAAQLVWPTGLHRTRPVVFPPAPYGAIAVQAFRYCRPCDIETAAVLHPGGAHTCTEGHLTVPGGNQ
jgi:hypothetical protein